MIPDIRWLDDPEVFAVGRMDAHSDHRWYTADGTELSQSLDGVWKFRWSRSPKERPENFFVPGADLRDFGEITVPCHMELAGYDRISYVNKVYPWEGVTYRRPAHTVMGDCAGMFSEAEYDPCGSYIRYFDLSPALRGKKVRVRFEGAEEALYLWLNGHFIGYAEDSFTPSEFDLTEYIKDEGNVLAAQVFKHSTAAWIEDQDMFRFSGIFRSVTLLGEAEAHIEDFFLLPTVDPVTKSGSIELRLKLNGKAEKLSVRVLYKDREILSRSFPAESAMELSISIAETVTLWSGEEPVLYRLELSLLAEEKILERVPWDFGFRTVDIKDCVLRLNGERLFIKGVNRHEWSPERGRVIGDAEENADILTMKRNNINAVRTSHYPNRLGWYEKCDRAGIYVAAEVNMESHGSWEEYRENNPWNIPGSFREWESAAVDRARSCFEWLKNHTSITFWSLGNESNCGDAFVKMQELFKKNDPSRPVHYESVVYNRAYRQRVSDFESHMYSTPDEVREYLESGPDKPFLLVEYLHSMGNSVGGMGEYMELFRYPRFVGGFIWDFVDQALYVNDEITGQRVLRYGGDFDDRPCDYEFSGDGLLFSTREEKPSMQEVRYWYGKVGK